jgi:signal transduction histidine kinase
VSIRFKVILPYLLLTLVVAVTGVYVVTKLVTSSLSERLTNQLLEAGRIVSDDFARQEIRHVETARIIAYTRGLAEALDGDHATVAALAKPVAVGLGIENLYIFNAQGTQALHLLNAPDGTPVEDPQREAAVLPLAQDLLTADDPNAFPSRGLALEAQDGHYYYFTALPVTLNDSLVGVVVVGTSLETLLPYLKGTSLADVIIYGGEGQAIGTTLGAGSTDPAFMQTLALPAATNQQILNSNESVTGENFQTDGRWYALARSSLRISNDRIGTFAVVLPLNFVIQSSSISRNTYVLLFTLAMIGVVLIGFAISRLIITPLSSLVRTSQAISGGDLTQRSSISSTDEIGVLAKTFDEMTDHLQQRTVELERTNRILEQMDRAKASFIQVSAHELRTPLTLIKGYTQMLEQKFDPDPEVRKLSKGILDGSERINEVVNNMLDVSKIDSQMLKIVPDNVQLGMLLMRVHKTFEEALTERNLNFSLDGVGSLPPIQADPDLLYKLFYHLVTNAIKYTPDGGSISVSGRVVDDQSTGLEVEVQVRDTGIGIAPEHLDLVFEKFFQSGEVLLHSSGKTKFKGGGPGLGLAIARGIAKAHGGYIWVESPGHDEATCPGSTFFVRLPIKGKNV